MSAIVERTTAPAAVLARLLSTFAALALLLAVVGVYGVVAYTVGQQTQEIGVRMALGAGARDVLAMVLRRGAMLAAAGIAAGLVLAAGAARGLRAYTSGVSSADPVAFGLGAAALLAAVLLASLLPALRATRVEPTDALRMD
jgi:ABC-type antimicrobial peptide transport system permease subunit